MSTSSTDHAMATTFILYLAGVGLVVLVHIFVKAVISAYKTFLRPAMQLTKLGKWAVVTGATDGIGKAYSLALAEKGMSVVLISRTEQKLQSVKEEIMRKDHDGVQVQYIVCDYTNFNQATKDMVSNRLDGLDIGVLVNNVGGGYGGFPRYFHELSNENVSNVLALNIDSTVWMTRIVLPGMLARRRGAIVNLSSAAGRSTLPLLAGYSAAKSFVEKFSRALNAEYRSMGVTCHCEAPFYIATRAAKERPGMTVPTAQEYVSLAIKWIGYADPVVSPFWMHAVKGWFLLQIPDFLLSRIVKQNLSRRYSRLKAEEAAAAKTK